MGNKWFDKVQFRTYLKEGSVRMKLHSDKISNRLYTERNKISEYVKKGEINRALQLIGTYINDERKIIAIDALRTICDQLQGRVTELESFGVTDDLKENINSLIYSSKRIDIKELSLITEMLMIIMKPESFQEAIDGVNLNEIIKENINSFSHEDGEIYLKLWEICTKTNTKFKLKDEWKFVLREYWYRGWVSYPYKDEEEKYQSISPVGLQSVTYSPKTYEKECIYKDYTSLQKSDKYWTDPDNENNLIEFDDYVYISSTNENKNYYPDSNATSGINKLPPLPEQIVWPKYIK